ncbi:hypothetical protein H6781_01520 [Candidatus Nomurabacteria bacterium]|nr:hypothetical protein [Candidatus Kaiserbacteria bacterium]MCB9810261.1 hypothetical protein [Candidatus Nomurabacteria bacterium]
MTFSHKNKFQIITILVSVFLLSFAVVSASSVVRTGETVSIAEDQVVSGDLYAAGGTVQISGVVEQDAVIMGGKITSNGEITQNAFLVAGGVDVHGPVGDDLRIVSGEVIVADKVEGDLFVMAGSVSILSSASIAGDLIIYAGDAVIEGPVGGDILGTVGELRIDTNVAGSVDVTVNTLTLGDRANVEGSLTYISSQVLERALNATIVGDLVRNDPVIPQGDSQRFSWLVPSLVLLFSVLAWYLVSRKSLSFVIGRALVNSPRPFLTGLITFIFVPVVIGLLFVSMIGSFVGVVLLLAYLLFIALSLIGMVAILGQLLMLAFNRKSKGVSLLALVVGIFGFILLSMLPTIGELIVFALMILTLGAIVDSITRTNPE